MKFFKTLMFIAAAAMAFTACSTEEGVVEKSGVKVSFTAVDTQTRTSFGEADGTNYPTLWTGNEEVIIGLNNISNGSTVKAAITTEDNKSAHWEAEITDDESGSYTLYALSPASAYLSTRAGGWGVTIPTTQTPLENSCDEAAQIIAAMSETTTTLPTSVKMQFKHVTAYGCFSFKNLELNGATVSSVALTAEKGLANRFNYDCASGTVTNNSVANSLTLNTNKTENIWFACAPVDLSGTVLKFVVTTDQGTFTKEITMAEGRAFQSGHIAKFTVDMTGVALEGPEKFELLTTASNLAAGDQVIIAALTYDQALSSTQNNNNRGQTAVTKEGNFIVSPGDAVEVFDVEAVGSNFAFKATKKAGYIYAASSSSNHLKTQATLNDNATWSVAISSNGSATVKAQGSNTRNMLRYNQSSSLFSCYSSGQKDIALYVKKGEVSTEPFFVAETANTSLAYFDTKATVNVSSNVAWTATVSGGVTFENGETTMTGEGNGSVVVAMGANEGTTARNFTVQVITEANVENNTYEFNFTQDVAKSFVLVTDAAEIREGDAYIFVANGKLAGGVTSDFGYLPATDVTVTDNKVAYNDTTAAAMWQFELDEDGIFYMVAPDGRYAWQKTTYKSYNFTSNIEEASTWTVAITDNVATIKSANGYWMQYDSNYGTYGCYSSQTGTNPSIYVLK